MKFYYALYIFLFCFFFFGKSSHVDAVRKIETTQSKFSRSVEHLLATSAIGSYNLKKRAQLATDSNKIWIFFASKIPDGTPPDYRSTALAEFKTNYLTERAAKRRAKSNAEILDDNDLPIFPSYLNVLGQYKGLQIRSKSNWLNAVSINVTSPEVLDQIAQLPFVTFIDRVAQFKRNIEYNEDIEDKDFNKGDKRAVLQAPGLNYGESKPQLDLVKVPEAHLRNLTGKGVHVMIMDSGFYKDHECFSGADIVAEWDFVQEDSNVQDRDGESRMSHGTQAWSNMGGRCPGRLFGPAYEASFLLAKTEDIRVENVVEEDNFVAALEWGEKLGADVVSASLGYDQWYTWSDLNGVKAVTTRGVNIATSKGMVVVVAQGNSGTSTKVMPVPADAYYAVSVGAVNTGGDLASFSSLGPTFDGRIKPEVVAPGVNNVVASINSPTAYSRNSGTSFATPIVAGIAALIVQAHPDWTNLMVREALMKSASHHTTPDVRRGWGVVNTIAAIDFSFSDSACPEGNCKSCDATLGCECKGDLYNFYCDTQRVDCRSFCEGTCGDDNICRCTTRIGRCVASKCHIRKTYFWIRCRN
jgi:serine protease AprX